VIVSLLAVARVRTFSHDSIEYDFSRLRRADSRISGEAYWGRKMDALLGRYLTPLVVLTDGPKEAASAERALRAAATQPPLAGVVDSVVRRSYNLVFHTAKYPDPQTLLEDVRSGATDGVLMIGDLPYAEVARSLAASSHPTVLVSQHLGDTPCFAVDCDNECGGYTAARHLIETGHRHIAFLLSVAQTWAEERLRGAERAVAEMGQGGVRLEVVPYTDTIMRDAEVTALHWLLGTPERPDAIICDREDPAPFLVEKLPQYGIRVPDDLSIVNFNSTERCSSARVPLTSVWQPLADIGESATDLLIDIIEKKSVVSGVRRFPVRLDIRDSTAPKHHAR